VNRSKTPCPAWSARCITAGRLSRSPLSSVRIKCDPYKRTGSLHRRDRHRRTVARPARVLTHARVCVATVTPVAPDKGVVRPPRRAVRRDRYFAFRKHVSASCSRIGPPMSRFIDRLLAALALVCFLDWVAPATNRADLLWSTSFNLNKIVPATATNPASSGTTMTTQIRAWAAGGCSAAGRPERVRHSSHSGRRSIKRPSNRITPPLRSLSQRPPVSCSLKRESVATTPATITPSSNM